jgi:hypothetical protein
MLFYVVWACTPIKPDPYGNGKYDTASDPSSEVVDTGDTTDTEDTDGVEDTLDTQDTIDTEEPVDPNAIEIYGLHLDNESNEHFFGNTAYSVDYGGGEMASYTYVNFSNPQRWLVVQNGSDTLEAGLYSRFDWNVEVSGKIWLCQTKSNATTATEAQNTPAANAFNTASGCNGGAWIEFL